jgi:hypothetical protein
MLEEIAGVDYGHKADQYLAGLRAIRDNGIIPKSMGWQRAEVLELIRWCNPDDPAQKPGAPGRRGHQMRVFSCAVLLLAAAEEGGGDSDEATLAQCLASAKVLGEEMNSAAASFMTWGISCFSSNDRWLFALGLLVVAMRFRNDRISDRMLGDVAEWFLDEETKFRREWQAGFTPAAPPPAAFGLTYGFWNPLIAELDENAANVASRDVHSNLELIGGILRDEL